MNIPELDDVSYVMITVESELHDGFGGSVFDDYDAYTITIKFFYNDRDLTKYKLLHSDVNPLDRFDIEISESEWISMLKVNRGMIETFKVGDGYILPFSLWLPILRHIPTRELHPGVVRRFSRYFKKDIESHNKVIEFHENEQIKKHEHRLAMINGYKKD